MSYQLLPNNRNISQDAIDHLGCDRPCHFGDILRHTANNLSLELLNDFWAALFPPLLPGAGADPLEFNIPRRPVSRPGAGKFTSL